MLELRRVIPALIAVSVLSAPVLPVALADEEGAGRAAPPVRAPIDWFPWTNEPFLRAQSLDRPILLVVRVQWNRQGVEFIEEALHRPDVAAVIRSEFVPVLVDGDLRPDIHRRYPGSGWPAVTVLTPLGDPVYYQSKREGARPLRVVLRHIDPEQVAPFLKQAVSYYRLMARGGAAASASYRRSLLEEMRPERSSSPIDASDLDRVAELLLGNQDVVHGGFGRAPKFLMPTTLEACLLRTRMTSDPAPLEAVERTLKAAGALLDTVEGGLHRLASNDDWSGVQYEKLLDRNASALEAYSDTYRATGNPLYLDRARRIAGYIESTLSLDNGGLSRGQSADMDSEDGGAYYRATAEQRKKMKAPETLRMVLSAANARGAQALMRYGSIGGDDRARERGLLALEYQNSALYRKQRGVLHAWDGRRALGPILLEDQLAFLSAHLEAYEQTGRDAHLEIALDVARFVRNNLLDSETQLLRDRIPLTAGPTPMQIPLFPYEENCEAARLFARLHYFRRGEKKEGWNLAARSILSTLASEFGSKGPRAADYGLAVAEYFHAPTWIVFVGRPAANPESQAVFDAAYRLDLPFRLRQILDPFEDIDVIRETGLIRRNPPAVYLSRHGETTRPASAPHEVLQIYQALLEMGSEDESPDEGGPDEAPLAPVLPGPPRRPGGGEASP